MTSHGKGVIDGTGGTLSTLKRTVWRHVKVERAHVTNPSQYRDLGKQLCPNIHIEYVSKEDIAQHTSFLDKKWENTKAGPGTHQVHCVRADGSDFVKVSDTTDSTECRRCQIRISDPPVSSDAESMDSNKDDEDTDPNEDGERTASNAIDVEVGQWAVVAYDGERYPGEVTALSDIEGVEVSVLHKSGSCWKWPQPKDVICYYKKDIVRLISPPIAAGHRGQFIFSDLYLTELLNICIRCA